MGHLILAVNCLTPINLILLVCISCISSWGLLIAKPFQTSEFLICVLLIVVLFWRRQILTLLLRLLSFTCFFLFIYLFNRTFLLFWIPNSVKLRIGTLLAFILGLVLLTPRIQFFPLLNLLRLCICVDYYFIWIGFLIFSVWLLYIMDICLCYFIKTLLGKSLKWSSPITDFYLLRCLELCWLPISCYTFFIYCFFNKILTHFDKLWITVLVNIRLNYH